MDFDVVLVVYIAEDIIAGNGMTAVWEKVAMDILLADEDRFLPVEIPGHDNQSLCRSRIVSIHRPGHFLPIRLQERHVTPPLAHRDGLLPFLLSPEFVQIRVAEDDRPVADSKEKTLMLLKIVQVTELVQYGGGHLKVVRLQPLRQLLLPRLLYLTALAAEDGLYLRLGLRRRDKVDP